MNINMIGITLTVSENQQENLHSLRNERISISTNKDKIDLSLLDGKTAFYIEFKADINKDNINHIQEILDTFKEILTKPEND